MNIDILNILVEVSPELSKKIDDLERLEKFKMASLERIDGGLSCFK